MGTLLNLFYIFLRDFPKRNLWNFPFPNSWNRLTTRLFLRIYQFFLHWGLVQVFMVNCPIIVLSYLFVKYSLSKLSPFLSTSENPVSYYIQFCSRFTAIWILIGRELTRCHLQIIIPLYCKLTSHALATSYMLSISNS